MIDVIENTRNSEMYKMLCIESYSLNNMNLLVIFSSATF